MDTDILDFIEFRKIMAEVSYDLLYTHIDSLF